MKETQKPNDLLILLISTIRHHEKEKGDRQGDRESEVESEIEKGREVRLEGKGRRRRDEREKERSIN
jgi:hypothetical protein